MQSTCLGYCIGTMVSCVICFQVILYYKKHKCITPIKTKLLCSSVLMKPISYPKKSGLPSYKVLDKAVLVYLSESNQQQRVFKKPPFFVLLLQSYYHVKIQRPSGYVGCLGKNKTRWYFSPKDHASFLLEVYCLAF